MAFMFTKKDCRESDSLITDKSVRCVGHKSYVTGTFDSCCKLSLMLCTSTCYTTGKNLRSVGSVLIELVYVLVINALNFINTEGTNLLAAFSVRTAVVLIISHYKIPPYKIRVTSAQNGRSSSPEISSKSPSDPVENEGAAGCAGAE